VLPSTGARRCSCASAVCRGCTLCCLRGSLAVTCDPHTLRAWPRQGGGDSCELLASSSAAGARVESNTAAGRAVQGARRLAMLASESALRCSYRSRLCAATAALEVANGASRAAAAERGWSAAAVCLARRSARLPDAARRHAHRSTRRFRCFWPHAPCDLVPTLWPHSTSPRQDHLNSPSRPHPEREPGSKALGTGSALS
jgi:hypothetical protein